MRSNQWKQFAATFEANGPVSPVTTIAVPVMPKPFKYVFRHRTIRGHVHRPIKVVKRSK